ncbi:MAG: hypothetical protein V3W37_09170 [Candidatus Binatia bacterium]
MASRRKLDPKEFIIPATDAAGHAERFQFRAVPALWQQMEVVVRSRKFPYKTPGDLLRHGFVRHLDWLQAQREVHPNNLKQIELMADVLREEQFQQEFTKTFETMANVVAHHISAGAVPEARRVVSHIRAHIRGMEDGYWKEKWERELIKRWGKLLDAKESKQKLKMGLKKKSGKKGDG